jgi:cytochrome c-type biogenesis protein CcmF
LGVAVALGLAVMLGIYGDRSLLGPLGVTLGFWIVLSALVDPVDRLRRGLSLPAAVFGMTLAHIGLGVMAVGITAMESQMMERDVALKPGESVTLGDYSFRFEGVQDVEGPNYDARRALIIVTRDGRQVESLQPERRDYWVQRQSLAEAALGVSWRRDVLVTLGESLGNQAWSVRVQVRPLMRWLWLGAALMALGGLVATLDKRYRKIIARESVVASGMAVQKA